MMAGLFRSASGALVACDVCEWHTARPVRLTTRHQGATVVLCLCPACARDAVVAHGHSPALTRAAETVAARGWHA